MTMSFPADDEPIFPFTKKSAGAKVADLQRKLASLDPAEVPEIIKLRERRCAGPGVRAVYDAETAAAVKGFKQRYGLGHGEQCDRATWDELTRQAGSVFSEVWQYELDALDGQPVPDSAGPARDDLAQRAHGRQLAGLAFSGGGIRSATFNLGILQALAELGLLKRFDYMSTVSGGGYIGAWLSRWLAREKGDIAKLEKELTPGAPGAPHGEADEVKFLRQYTNYLTPRTGLFSADTWALLATYVRNMTLNLTILVTVLLAVMVVPRLLATVIKKVQDPSADATAGSVATAMRLGHDALRTGLHSGAIACVAVLWSVFMIALHISSRPGPGEHHRLFRQTQGSVIRLIVVPLMVAACLGSVGLWHARETITFALGDLLGTSAMPAGYINPLPGWILGSGLAYFVAWAAGWGWAQQHNASHAEGRGATPPDSVKEPLSVRLDKISSDALSHLLCAVIALGLGTMAVLAATRWLAQVAKAAGAPQEMTVPVVALGMPVLLILFGLTMMLCVGLVGRRYSDKSREWWSRQIGWTTIIASGWVALVAVSLYAPGVMAWLVDEQLGGWVAGLLGSGWLATTWAGVIAGRSKATGPVRTTAGDPAQGTTVMEWVARVAPPVFSVGALCLVAVLLHHALRTMNSVQTLHFPQHVSLQQVLVGYDAQTMQAAPLALLVVFGGLLAIGLLLAWRVDINKFSLHMMYRNRLVRAYLGASNDARAPHPFTGFDPGDDLQLARLLKKDGLAPAAAVADQDAAALPAALQRPYHIINTTLNLVGGKDLAWQSRKAAAFAFTPAFCGFELPRMAAPGGACLAQESLRGCFRSTSSYTRPPAGTLDEEGGVQLGMAMAVSGAAASPSMGFHSSPPLAFLMTMFNVRLGRWFANPAIRVKGRSRRDVKAAIASAAGDGAVPGASLPQPLSTSPLLGIRYLLNELFGLTDARSNYLYLSDGGHFENLGVYELVRRRCRLVVVVDAGADGQFDFSDLGDAIRKCATDLSVEIEIDVGKIDLLKDSGFSAAHCVTGRIRYDKIDVDGRVGTLLYIKPSLLGKEMADILNYRKINKTFPHQSTLDQWFDETQFETYRALGYNIGKIVLEPVVQGCQAVARQAATAISTASSSAASAPAPFDIATFCTVLAKQWPDRLPPIDPVPPDQMYVAADRRYTERRGAQGRPPPQPDPRSNVERRVPA